MSPHGTDSRYQDARCRCVPCKSAHATAHRAWREGTRGFVDAAYLRKRLRHCSLPMNELASMAGVSADTLSNLRRGKYPRIRATTQTAILAALAPHGGRIDYDGLIVGAHLTELSESQQKAHYRAVGCGTITRETADEIACALGWHPANLWPEFYETAAIA